MRLVRISSSGELSLTPDLHHNNFPYAILSHTWGSDEDKVSFDDIQRDDGSGKSGYAKLSFCREQAGKDGLEYFWIDTCCINKGRDAELSEALNSMFRWYAEAARCYVYLADVGARKRPADDGGAPLWEPAFRKSKWFTRGWTLQELLAPEHVDFFSRNGNYLGSKKSLIGLICEITQIPVPALLGAPLPSFSLNERFSWAATRQTKRIEDEAYCLMGIFGIHMPPIYGEGKNALARLKKELGDNFCIEPRISSERAPVIISREGYRAKVMASLKFSQMQSRKETIKSAYSTTCQWFLRHPTYVKWLEHDNTLKHRGFLWIKGKPGAGKSTLMKFIHSSAEEQEYSAANAAVISFFFNARGDDLERSTMGLNRSLLYQLLKKIVVLQELLDRVEFLQMDETDTVAWTVEKLQNLLSQAIAKSEGWRIRCFIDALDECDEQQVREMVLFWEDVIERTMNSKVDLYVCFSSRHYPTIDIHDGPQIVLEKEYEHQKDMAKYVRRHLRGGNESRFEDIRGEIIQLANGVFIWAVLVVEMLNDDIRRGRDYAMLNRLREIPPKLSDLFKAMITRDGENTEDMLMCLRLILFAKRPLDPYEFYFAMIAGLDPREDYLCLWNPDETTIQVVTQRVLDSSKGLAEITPGEHPKVQLIHESVRDFLIKENGLSVLFPGPAKQLESSSHDQLKQCCLEYLKANSYRYVGANVAESFYVADSSEFAHRKFGPFLKYAAMNVLHHANDAAESIDQLSFLRELDLRSLVRAMNETQAKMHKYSENASLIYVLACHSAARLIRVARENGWSDSVKGEHYLYPLFAALVDGDEETVLTLLDFGHRDEALTSPEHLQTGGRSRIQSSYLVNTKLNLRDSQGKNALCWAAARGFENVTRLLLAAGQRDENSSDKHGRRALSHAAGAGRTSIIRLLFDYNADVHAVDGRGRAAIHWSWNLRVLQLLLEHHADVNACQEDGTTALHGASDPDDFFMASELIQRGANIEAADADGHTPLHHASAGRSDRLVSLLLDHNASLEAADKYGMTALLWAISYGHLSTLNTLLRAGSDLHRIDKEGNTALMHSVGKSANITRLLLDRGLSADAANRSGVTPLMYAAQQRDNIFIENIVTRVADIDVQDDYGWTALLHASMCGRDLAVKTLLLNGANVHAVDHNGNTALMLAVDLSQYPEGSRYPEGSTRPSKIRTRKLPPAYEMQLMLLEQQNKKRLLMAREETFLENRGNIIRLLLKYGAQPYLSRKDGKTAITLAKEARLDDIVQYLEKHGRPV